jgi:hypothetical protein
MCLQAEPFAQHDNPDQRCWLGSEPAPPVTMAQRLDEVLTMVSPYCRSLREEGNRRSRSREDCDLAIFPSALPDRWLLANHNAS